MEKQETDEDSEEKTDSSNLLYSYGDLHSNDLIQEQQSQQTLSDEDYDGSGEMSSYLCSYPRKRMHPDDDDEDECVLWKDEGDVIPETPDFTMDLGPERDHESRNRVMSCSGLEYSNLKIHTPPPLLQSIQNKTFYKDSEPRGKRIKLETINTPRPEFLENNYSEDMFSDVQNRKDNYKSVILDETKLSPSNIFRIVQEIVSDCGKDSVPEISDDNLTEEYNPDVFSTPLNLNKTCSSYNENSGKSVNITEPLVVQDLITFSTDDSDHNDTNQCTTDELASQSYPKITKSDNLITFSPNNSLLDVTKPADNVLVFDENENKNPSETEDFSTVKLAGEMDSELQNILLKPPQLDLTKVVLAEIQNVTSDKLTKTSDSDVNLTEDVKVDKVLDKEEKEEADVSGISGKLHQSKKKLTKRKKKPGRRSFFSRRPRRSRKVHTVVTKAECKEIVHTNTSSSTVELNITGDKKDLSKTDEEIERLETWTSHNYVHNNTHENVSNMSTGNATVEGHSIFKVPSSSDSNKTPTLNSIETVYKEVCVKIKIALTVDNVKECVKNKQIVGVQIVSLDKLKNTSASTTILTSSSGSVYSDNSGFPYQFPKRTSLPQSTSTSSCRETEDSEPLPDVRGNSPVKQERDIEKSSKTKKWSKECAIQEVVTSTINMIPDIYLVEKTDTVKKDVEDILIESSVDVPVEQSADTTTVTVADTNTQDRVLARWIDKNYYCGRVVKRDMISNRCEVEFDDGGYKTVHNDFIFPFHILQPGCLLFACVDSKQQTYKSGKLISCKTLKTKKVEYIVELDENSKTVCVNSSELYMTQDMIAFIKPGVNFDVPGSDINLDNILDCKRRSRSSSCSPISQTKKSSVHRRDKQTAMEQNCLAGLEVDTVVNRSLGVITSPLNNLHGNRLRGKGPSALGCLPPEGSDIFKGYIFLLTSTGSNTHVSTRSKMSSDSEFSETEDRDLYNSNYPFNQTHLINQLTSGGGVVIEQLDLIDKELYKKCRLVTNRPCNTYKYMSCITSGIAVILHVQIIHICNELNNSQINKHLEGMLNSTVRHHIGWSIEEKKWKEWPQSKMGSIFNNVRVYLESDKDDFLRTILTNTGAKLVSQGELGHVDVILSDSPFPTSLVDMVKELGENAPVLLSTYWLWESIIQGKMCSYTGHQLYNYIYQDKTQALPSTSNQ